VECAADMMLLLADNATDIVPPVNYSLVPPWMIFVVSLLALTIIGLAIWYGRKLFQKKKPVPTPQERALAALNEIEKDVERTNPYQFSIRVSDILRRYVMEQFDLPMTRQTSVEFLNAIGSAASFGCEDDSVRAQPFSFRRQHRFAQLGRAAPAAPDKFCAH